MIRAHEAVIMGVCMLVLVVFFAMSRVGVLREAPSTEEGWAASIHELGGERAYRLLGTSVTSLSEGKQHMQAHFFGAALYAKEGLEGLSVCDAQFSYGCFHEFLGRAIADLGIDSVVVLNERCFETLGKNGLSCQHGIGHGVQSFFGYTEEDLQKALDTCSRVAHNDPIGGCYSGAFMEYNFQTTLGDQAALRQSEDMSAPCSVVGAPYRDACLFSQPQWWYRSVFAPRRDPDVFVSLGQLCDRVAKTRSEREQCYRGIGNVIPEMFRFDPIQTGEACLHVSARAREQLACVSTAANAIGVMRTHEKGEKACGVFSGEGYEYCLLYARNEANALIVEALPEHI